MEKVLQGSVEYEHQEINKVQICVTGEHHRAVHIQCFIAFQQREHYDIF